MKIEQLHLLCKNETRNAFDEFKRQIDVRLFPFDEDLKDNLQRQMFEQIGMGITKNIFKEQVFKNDLRVLIETLNYYKYIAYKTSNNYSRKYLHYSSKN